MVFSAVETSLLSYPRAALQQRSKAGDLVGRAFKEWLEHPNRILTSILIGNNTVVIAATTITAFISVHAAEINHWGRGLTGTVASAAVTFIVIVFGEAIPKVVGRTYALHTAQWLVGPLYLFDRLLVPLTWGFAKLAARLFPKLGRSAFSLVTEDDIKHMIEIGRESGAIQEEEKKMIHSIFKFTDTKVSEVMVPRTAMFCVNIHTNFDHLLELVVQNGYSRMPVYKGNVDNIVGIIYTRDLLSIWANKELILLQDLLRKPYFVPESMRVDRLLQEFKRGKFHMAIVVDEYGGTAGLVTLEDLVEEIVGEIRDEYDTEEEKPIARQEDGSWIIETNISLDSVNEVLGTSLSAKGDVASLGGYLMEKIGKVPRKGRVIEDHELVFTVLEGSDKRIFKVRVVKRKVPIPSAVGPAPVPPEKTRRKRAKTPRPPESPEPPDSSMEKPKEP
jgi:putative hemolysin